MLAAVIQAVIRNHILIVGFASALGCYGNIYKI